MVAVRRQLNAVVLHERGVMLVERDEADRFAQLSPLAGEVDDLARPDKTLDDPNCVAVAGPERGVGLRHDRAGGRPEGFADVITDVAIGFAIAVGRHALFSSNPRMTTTLIISLIRRAGDGQRGRRAFGHRAELTGGRAVGLWLEQYRIALGLTLTIVQLDGRIDGRAHRRREAAFVGAQVAEIAGGRAVVAK